MYLKYPFPAFRGKLRLIFALLVLPLLLTTGCSGSDTGNTASDKAQKDQDSHRPSGTTCRRYWCPMSYKKGGKIIQLNEERMILSSARALSGKFMNWQTTEISESSCKPVMMISLLQ